VNRDGAGVRRPRVERRSPAIRARRASFATSLVASWLALAALAVAPPAAADAPAWYKSQRILRFASGCGGTPSPFVKDLPDDPEFVLPVGGTGG
jgi:hypothetical protein